LGQARFTPRRSVADARVVIHKDLPFDPVLTTGDRRLVGLHMRRAGDSLMFEPLPYRSAAVTVEDRLEPSGAVTGFVTPVGPGQSELLPGLRLAIDVGLRRQSLILPKIGMGQEERLAWLIESHTEMEEVWAVIGRTNRFVVPFLAAYPEHDSLDMNVGAALLELEVGDGFMISVIGDVYAFMVIFRLVTCSRPSLTVVLRRRENDLEIVRQGDGPVEAAFLVTPSPQRIHKFVAGRISASLRLSEIALAVHWPFPP
jgi:hypothetical protein